MASAPTRRDQPRAVGAMNRKVKGLAALRATTTAGQHGEGQPVGLAIDKKAGFLDWLRASRSAARKARGGRAEVIETMN